MAMAHGNAYVAQRGLWARKDVQTVKAFIEAESFPARRSIIASPLYCHGTTWRSASTKQKLAVETGYWPSIGTTRGQRGRARARSSSSRRRPSSTSAIHAGTDRFRVVEQQNPDAIESSLAMAQQQRWQAPCPVRGVARWRDTDGQAGSARQRQQTTQSHDPERYERDHRRRRSTMDLSTTYLGLTLPHPLMSGAIPARRPPRPGTGASRTPAPRHYHALAVREQLLLEPARGNLHFDQSGSRSPRRSRISPTPTTTQPLAPMSTSSRFDASRRWLDVPVFYRFPERATGTGWVEYARLIQQAGADASS